MSINNSNNNTLGHLPRKPLSINPKRNTSIGITGLLTNNLSPTNPTPTQNSIGFSKSGNQSFGRVGDASNQSQQPSQNHFNSNNNNNNNNVNPINLQSNSNSSTFIQPETNDKLKKYQNPINQVNINKNNQVSHQTTNSQNRTRKLGSFNSLAINQPINPSNHLNLNPVSTHHSFNLDQSNQPKLNSPQNLIISNDHHKLRFSWVFWSLHRSPSKKMNDEEFSKAMRRLGSCDTVETFFSLYCHIKRPSTQTPISDIHLFSDPIKPVWEDPLNVKGGKWTIRLKKGLSNRLWEMLVFSLIGGGLEKLIASDDGKEICGAVLSIRKEEDILAIWHKTGNPESGGDGKMAKQVKLSLQTVLQLPLNCTLAYKLNADSLASGKPHHYNNHHHHHHQHHQHHHHLNHHQPHHHLHQKIDSNHLTTLNSVGIDRNSMQISKSGNLTSGRLNSNLIGSIGNQSTFAGGANNNTLVNSSSTTNNNLNHSTTA
ncbi:hypothetical protein O181_026845 [Austropuccinia psidii MF-1]|uniref:Uncharacterized protein n=1 Tax=Austropuccinia psidii MF-1 TaxID=1389203 RepID=A0A9Q3CQ68_9BASI|nr:hypothetical protein [Austropuccinia psidii MF-1]